MKDFLSTKLGKTCATVVLLLFIFWLILRFRPELRTWPLLEPILLTLILTTVALVLVELGFKTWQRRRQASFDAKMAAREGIEDRRREWAEWTAELRRQGIDRYQLPMYLLVGEPQSGKSIMLRNSDLHFPFGQNRLSGVGGTRGCDWWFTDQAVILDLAGRLFTHEGGASDEAEWAAFLEMLADYRPQCPANGVILVLPCDGLASEAEPAIVKKAAKMQSALLTLTNRLQARLPVYVVLTKADKIFGFAECVHRLEAEKRHEMFGWSRPLEKLEAPFDIEEARSGFLGLVERGRLLRSQMMATARIPEALSEVDRFYAFPEELSALWPMLDLYLQRIFTQSQLIDQLFFRGMYLTSGLQSGAPIAKVCAELLGGSGDADRRNLEALFTKQRAYFIKELVRERIFTEQGLVRPTRQRVARARQTAFIAYGLAAAIALASIGWSAWDIRARMSDEKVSQYEGAIASGLAAKEDPENLEVQLGASESLALAGEIERPLQPVVREAAKTQVNEFLIPLVTKRVGRAFADSPWPIGHGAFLAEIENATHLLTGLDLNDPKQRGFLDRLDLDAGQTKRLKEIFGYGYEYETVKISSNDRQLVLDRAVELWDRALQGGSGWAKPGALGVVLASNELLVNGRYQRLDAQAQCLDVYRHANAIDLLVLSSGARKTKDEKAYVVISDAKDDLAELEEKHAAFIKEVNQASPEWQAAIELRKTLTGDRMDLHSSLKGLFDDSELGSVCTPSFLAQSKAASKPNDLLKDLAARPAGVDALSIYVAKCRCIAQAYIDAFPKLALLRERVASGNGGLFALELSEHLGELERALSDPTLNEWHQHINELIDEYEGELLIDWASHKEDMPTQLVQHLGHISPSVGTRGREKRLAAIVNLLVGVLGTSFEEAAGNFYTFTNLGRDKSERYNRTLGDGVRDLVGSPDLKGRKLSSRLVEIKSKAKGPPANGTGWYVEQLFKAFCELAFRRKVRPEVRAELETLLKGPYSGLVEALWGAAEQDPRLQFFDRGGEFDKLWDGYSVARAGLASSSEAESWSFEQFRPSAEDAEETAFWKAVGFLREIQAFVLAGGDQKTALGSTLKISIDCSEGSPVFEKGGYFYMAPGLEDSIEVRKKGMKLADQKWSFDSKDLYIRWSSFTDSFKSFRYEEGDYGLRERGPFAPLRLAWEHGSRVDGSKWRVTLDLEQHPNKKATLPCTVDLLFERDFPERPADPPFVE